MSNKNNDDDDDGDDFKVVFRVPATGSRFPWIACRQCVMIG